MLSRQSSHEKRHPSDCYRITVARGKDARTYALRGRAVHAIVLSVAAGLAWGVVATLYLAFHDDLTSVLNDRQGELRYAYEDRLAAMRNQLDRATSQQLVNQTSVDGKVGLLLSRQQQLEARASMLQSILDRARPGSPAVASGSSRGRSEPALAAARRMPFPADAASAIAAAVGTHSPAMPADAAAFRSLSDNTGIPAVIDDGKPRPEGVDALGHLGPTSDASPATPDGAATENLAKLPPPAQLAAIDRSLDRLEALQSSTVAQVAQDARDRATRLDAALAQIGLSPDRLARSFGPAAGMGGPFVPLGTGQAAALGRDLGDLQNAMLAAARLESVLPHVPLRRPSLEANQITSGFGPRVDPFNGRAAMHTGIDFALPYGAGVHATAGGRVTIAGPDGGYGNLVEIDHGNGLSTRYGHLSEILVTVGETVAAGAVVGNVGATGRATGPHLHYETRIDGEAVDPIRFLRAGQTVFAAQ